MTDYNFQPIGRVINQPEEAFFAIQLDPPFAPGLQRLDEYSHVYVIWLLNASADAKETPHVLCHPPYPDAGEVGVFACRSPRRPNPIGLTLTEIVRADPSTGLLQVTWLDAFDGTPVLDLKPYIPASDRVQAARTPAWMAGWPEWYQTGKSPSQSN